MDVERVNSVLVQAIVGLQDSEVGGLAEAMGYIGAGSQSYRVPSPAEMGFVVQTKSPSDKKSQPKKKKEKKGGNWVEKVIQLHIGPGHIRTEDAWVKGVWAVHRDSRERRWEISHVPAGVVVAKGLDSKMVAKATVDEWISQSPSMLRLGMNKKPSQASDVLRAFKKQRKKMKPFGFRDPRYVS
jgi:hypothetical protein